MSTVIELLSWFCFLTGSFLCITGGVGLLRFPDFFTRVHAVSVTETLASPLIIIGLMLQSDFTLDTMKLMLILLFMLATNPTAAHAMAKAALHGGQKPLHIPETEDNTGGESSKP